MASWPISRDSALVFGKALAIALGAAACTETSPIRPTPVVVRGGAAAGNAAPVVRSVSVSARTVEAGEAVSVSAVVEDADTAPGGLTYEWQASAGVISGGGATVTWRLPPGETATPTMVAITVTVVEAYAGIGPSGKLASLEHRVSAQAPSIRAHDSVAELGRMALTFLVDYFGDSRVSPDACLVDFSDTCPGKADERRDIVNNRQQYVILEAQATIADVRITDRLAFATVAAQCSFRSRDVVTGAVGTVVGDCVLTAIYEADRWWLCTSHFLNGVARDGTRGGPVGRPAAGGSRTRIRTS
jgi:hypothetical protein